MNEVKIAGKIQKDPTIRYTAAGLCWAAWTTVVEIEGKKGRVFAPCKAFGEVAEELEKMGKANCFITIEGRLTTGSYTNKQGIKVFTVDVVAEKIDYSKGMLPDDVDTASEQTPSGFTAAEDDFPF